MWTIPSIFKDISPNSSAPTMYKITAYTYISFSTSLTDLSTVPMDIAEAANVELARYADENLS